MKKQLYELVDQLKFLEDSEPIDADNEKIIQEAIVMTNLAIETKVDGVAKYVLSLKADIEAYKSEETRLHSRKQAMQNRVEWLKNYLLTEMKSAGIDKVKGEVCTISIQRSPISIEITNLDAVPKEFKKVIIEGRDVFDGSRVERSLVHRAVGFEYEEVTRSIDPDSDEFLDILPKGEYKFKDNNDYICARVDKHFNIHYLVEDFKGFIQYRTVNLKSILL